MTGRTIDHFARLPEAEAVREYFDSQNLKFFGRFRTLFLQVAFVLVVVLAVRQAGLGTGLAILNVVILLVAALARDSEWVVARIRLVVIAGLVGEQLILALLSESAIMTILLCSILFPAMLLFTRLESATYAGLGATFATTSIVTTSLLGDASAERIAIPVIFNVIAIVGATKLTSSDRRSFLREWRVLASNERERQRMREELADARKIQLAMLPVGPPRLDWLELASLSLPATEVGGDFYDYLALPEGRIAIVIGDVAGHGVASGIVLAGVKSGLQLLRDELSSPVAAVEKLNRVIRDWLQWRMLVSMLLAIGDPAEKTFTVVTAGQPPLLHYSHADRVVRPVGHGALPLGTRLPARYRVDVANVRSGDSILLFTDGVTEQANERGGIFGQDRLEGALAKAAPSGRPRIIREAIMDELAHFKGDAPQLDDVSFVIGRVRFD